MITVFGKEWFKKYNKQLCWIANSFVGDWIFKISKMGHDKKKYGKITEMHPNAITHKQRLLYDFEKRKTEQEYTTQFFSRNEYALRLQKVFYPIWITFHTWDMLIANKFKPAWNLGFDTLTVYPDANPESTSVDGNTGAQIASTTWASVRSSAGNYSSDSGSYSFIVGFRSTTTTDEWGELYRGVFLFDTSALTASAEISATTLSLYGQSKSDNLSVTPNINIYTSTPASNTALTGTDFSTLGTIAQCDTPITYAGYNTSGYNDFTLNATGRGNVSKTSISKFGARNVNYDVDNVAPSWSSNVWSLIYCYMADNGSNKPKLVVTYTIPGNDYFQTCSETIAINDTLLNKTSRVFTEAISIIDSISIQKTLKRTLSEVITIVDNINAKKIAVKTISETISIVDTIKMNISKVFSETITIVDNLLIQKVLKRTFSETISIVDSIEKSIIKFKTLVENISIVDSITKKTSKTFTEAVTIADTLSKQLIKIKIFSEAITITDSFSKRISRTFTETISIISSFAAQTYKVARATIKYTGQVLSKLNNTEQIKAKIKKIINN